MSELSDFLKGKNEEHKRQQINFHEIREQWLANVAEFMKNIKSWIAASQAEGLLKVREYEIEINEENLRNYKVTALELIVGDEKIQITPVGRMIIGAIGRIDISSSYNKFIVLQKEENEWIFRNDQSKEKFKPFTENDFVAILKELV